MSGDSEAIHIHRFMCKKGKIIHLSFVVKCQNSSAAIKTNIMIGLISCTDESLGFFWAAVVMCWSKRVDQ